MIKYVKFLFLISILFLNSCGIRSRSHSGEYFTKNTTFTIVNNEDRIGTKLELEKNLISSGFKVISYPNAVNAVKNKTPIKDSEVNKGIEKVYSIKDIDDIYSIELFYEYYNDIFTYSYRKFSYEIKNMNTGQTVTYGYHQGMNDTMKTVLKKLSEKINMKVRKI